MRTSWRGSRATPPAVPHPRNRRELQAMDSHVYGQLTAALSTEATRTVADDFYRNRGDVQSSGISGAPAKAGADCANARATKPCATLPATAAAPI